MIIWAEGEFSGKLAKNGAYFYLIAVGGNHVLAEFGSRFLN
jgi:hypothetical protein